ncbi:BLOC-2 complex member HPS3-like isoform X2 [Dreissena polymorpha]|uniref:Uncharacterized protein n=1 Tax=Dreissena polymorpha TaxID=45954 RepID=A0A9D4M2V0_DREPO|nr:BLOC-2 complex member HPS3-like isoform X2 [Dreissena polymorpha]KAH3868314.1 hypothetical protein DPMN_031457 [Dreissena polymorpha]
MVKVLKCYNFRKSHIIENLSSEPRCFASGANFLFAGSSDCRVEVFKRQQTNSWSKYCFFQTGAHVEQIEYNITGDYIATIERKSSRISEVVSVKVYLNWHIANTDVNYRTRVRVAGLGYKSTNVQTGQRLEVVDVISEKPASFLSSCQETSNLAIAFHNQIRLYQLVEKTITNSNTIFVDVIVFLELTFCHTLTKLSLCEEFLTCSSTTCVQVFKIHIASAPDDLSLRPVEGQTVQSPSLIRRKTSSVLSSRNIQQQLSRSKEKTIVKSTILEQAKFSSVGERSSTTPSPLLNQASKNVKSVFEDDADFVHWTFDLTPDSKVMTQPAGARGVSNHDNATLRLKGLERLGKHREQEPFLPEIKDLQGGNHLTTGRTTLVQVLHRYLEKRGGSWVHLQLLPYYQLGRDPSGGIHSGGVPVHSARRQSLVGMSCLVSSSRHGHMFTVLSDPVLLSTYEYAMDAIQVESNGHLVFALSNNTLEVFTSRSQIAAVHSMETFNNITKTCPRLDVEICICGVQQFFGPKCITLGNGYVALFNKYESVWNMNVMEEPLITELYRDMVRFGKKNQELAALTYEHLLLEGHMLLQGSLIGQELSQSEFLEVNELIKESAALLGEFYALSDCLGWHNCLPYCLMSSLPVTVMVQRILDRRALFKLGFSPGMTQYLKYVLFLNEDPLENSVAEGDQLLNICLETMPEALPDVLLISRLKTFSPKLGIQLLKSASKSRKKFDSTSSTTERLAMVSLNLQLCEPDAAMGLLSSIDKRALIEACVGNHQILLDGLREFSPLAQLLRCHNSDLLITILVELHDKGSVPMDLAIALLQGRSNAKAIHRNTHVMAYLEAVVSDERRKFSYEEAVTQLCEIYIHRMVDWEPPSVRELSTSMKFKLPSGGHFGRRHHWLDQLPPFSGFRSITSTCSYVVPMDSRRAGKQAQHLLQCQKTDKMCTCFLCNEDLLKLQSLLCYGDISTMACGKLLSLLDKYSSELSTTSLRVLCYLATDMDEAMLIIVRQFPLVAGEFAAAVFKTDTLKWEHLLGLLLAVIKASNSTDNKSDPQQNVKALKDVLSEMAHHLKPEALINLLPGDGNFFFFMPFIQQCLAVNKSALLKERFVELGENLQSRSAQ